MCYSGIENNKIALLEAGALVVLVDALKCTDPDMKEVTQRYVAVAICDLIQGNGMVMMVDWTVRFILMILQNRHTQILHTGFGRVRPDQAHFDIRRNSKQ